ncbi:MAG: ATP-binding protein [Thermodesulfobacteriota bacterium]
MAKKGLEKRIVAILLPLLILWFLVFSLVFIYKGKRAGTRQMVKEVRQLTGALTSIKYQSLSGLAGNIKVRLDKSTWISVYDKGLNRIASTAEEKIDGGEDLRIAWQTGSQVEGFVEEGGKRIYHIVTPLFSENGKGDMEGLLEVGTSLGGISRYTLSSYRDIFIVLILGIGILGAVFHLSFRRHISTPIQKLTGWTTSPEGEIGLNATGEISTLAHALGNTVQRMRGQIGDLERSHIRLEEILEKKEREVRKMKQDLEEAQFHLVRAGTLSALGEFAAGISHELNNPLGIIMGFSQVLLDEVDPGHPHYKSLKRIEMESSRCKKIVNDLLNFARPSEPHLEVVQLNEVIEETLQLIRYQIPFENIKVTKKYHAALPPVLVDPGQMEQVLMNIITNAVQAMSQGGELIVSTSVCNLTQDECRQFAASSMDYRSALAGEQDYAGVSKRVWSKKDTYKPGDEAVEIDISDTGCGISKENLGKLFHPFFTTKKGGTGLGLSICWKLVEKQGGIIGVRSVEGEGTTFSIKIPLRKNGDG